MPDSIHAEVGHGAMTAAISDAMVGLLSNYTGRGATSSWTTVGKDLVVCVMSDALTKGEKRLVQNGDREAVLAIRKAYQASMAEEAMSVVEDLTGRRVAAFMSSNHIDPDLAVETFVLQPSPGDPDWDNGSDGRPRLR
jgi:uncharacterized protein YbcI